MGTGLQLDVGDWFLSVGCILLVEMEGRCQWRCVEDSAMDGRDIEVLSPRLRGVAGIIVLSSICVR